MCNRFTPHSLHFSKITWHITPPASTVHYLGTSTKHLHLRRVAHGTYLKTIHKMKARYAKSHRIARFSKGDKVAVNIPRKDRSSTTLQRLPCIVVEVLGSQQNTYRLQCRHGVINKCYPGGNWLEPYTGGLEIKCPSKIAPQLSLREAVKKEYPSLLLGDRCHTPLRLSGQWEAMPGPLPLWLKLCKQRRQKRYISALNSSNSTYTALYMTKLLLSHKVQSWTPKVVGLEHHRLQLQSGTHSLLCTNNTGTIGVSAWLLHRAMKTITANGPGKQHTQFGQGTVHGMHSHSLRSLRERDPIFPLHRKSLQ